MKKDRLCFATRIELIAVTSFSAKLVSRVNFSSMSPASSVTSGVVPLAWPRSAQEIAQDARNVSCNK